jgi:cytochrome c-type biogenesis protein CcmH/NrfG
MAWGVITVLALLSLRGVRAAREGFWLLATLLLALPEHAAVWAPDLASGRRFYLPMAACAALAGLLLRQTPRAVLSVIAVLFLLITVSQVMLWRNETTLWMESARLSPNELRPQLELAARLEPVQAAELLEEANAKHPGNARLEAQLAGAYTRAGKPSDARRILERALRHAPCDSRLRLVAKQAAIEPPACPATSEP